MSHSSGGWNVQGQGIGKGEASSLGLWSPSILLCSLYASGERAFWFMTSFNLIIFKISYLQIQLFFSTTLSTSDFLGSFFMTSLTAVPHSRL